MSARTTRTSYRELFGEISRAADVLVLAGDLTDLGKPREARNAGAGSQGLLDSRSSACSAITITNAADAGGGQRASCAMRHEGARRTGAARSSGVGFVGVKGFAGGFGRRMLGSFGEPAIKQFVAETMNETMRLENAMRTVRAKRSRGDSALRAHRRHRSRANRSKSIRSSARRASPKRSTASRSAPSFTATRIAADTRAARPAASASTTSPVTSKNRAESPTRSSKSNASQADAGVRSDYRAGNPVRSRDPLDPRCRDR